MIDRPLAGIRVVDCVHGPLASTTRYLAELGATVDRIAPDWDDALADAAANAGKRRHRFDFASAEARALLARADIVVEDVGVDLGALRRARPGLVAMSVSPLGRDGPLSHWRASDAVLHALSGELSRSGIRGRAPLLPPGRLAWECAAVQAAFVLLQSYFLALRSGQGDAIDFAALDGAVQALDPGFGIGGSATLGRPASQLSRDRPARGFQYPIFACADGHVRICLLAARQWQGMFQWLGGPAAFADPSFNKTAVRYKSGALTEALAGFFATRTRSDLEREAAAHGVPLSGLALMAETPGIAHFVERHAFRRTEVAGWSYALPNGCMVIDGERMSPDAGVEGEAPMAGNEAVSRPFAGLRVLDLGVIVVGAETGRLLADGGADVVKLESRAFPDGNRQSYLSYGLSASFAAGHRNKAGLGLDLRNARGQALFLELVARADVLLANFKPGTLASLGLDRERLAAVNPRLVSVESSAFGDTGPWSHRMGYGPLVRAATGLTEAWRYPDDREGYSDSITIYPDHVAARIGAIAAVALLVRRHRTGRGGSASIAQAEVMLAQFGAPIARAFAGEAQPKPESEVHRCWGEDEWCVVATNAPPDLVPDGRVLGEWLADTGPREAAETLQAQGVAASPMLRVADLTGEPYFTERGIFRAENHPNLSEPVIAEARQARGRVPLPKARPAPLVGEDSAKVLADWLSLDDDRIAALAADGVIELVDPAELSLIAETLSKARAATP